MTSPIVEVEVHCPGCEHVFKTYYRASISHWEEDADETPEQHLRQVNTATCPIRGKRFSTGPSVIVRGDSWTFS